MVKKIFMISALIIIILGSFFAYVKILEHKEYEVFEDMILGCAQREKPRCFAVINDDVSYCQNNTGTLDKCISDYYWYKSLSTGDSDLCNSIPLKEKEDICKLTGADEMDCSQFEYESFGYDAPTDIEQKMCNSINSLDENICYDMHEQASTHCLFLTLFYKTLKDKDLQAAKEHYKAWKRLENTSVSIEAYVTKDPLDCVPRECVLTAVEIMSFDDRLDTGDKTSFKIRSDCDFIKNQKIKEICKDSFY